MSTEPNAKPQRLRRLDTEKAKQQGGNDETGSAAKLSP